MNDGTLPVLDSEELARRARAAPRTPCPACAALACPGWCSVPGAFDRQALRCVATLRQSADDEPTLQEHHPGGTDGWSPVAPIAPAFFPYNRCEVRACKSCGRLFLHYTEYGGYYQEERIREIDPALIDPARPAP